MSIELMKQYNQFVLYALTNPREVDGYLKHDKVPMNPHTLTKGDAHDPNNWLSYVDACNLSAITGYSIGFTFTKNDPFYFFDIDKCIDARGVYTHHAKNMCNWFNGAFVELSLSKRGLHIIGVGTPTVEDRKKKNKELDFDLYTDGRFVALTFDHISGDVACPDRGMLDQCVAAFFTKTAQEQVTIEMVDAPADGWRGPSDDDELLAKMLESGSVASKFGERACFRDLWEANEDALAKFYPPDDHSKNGFDHSAADAALLQLLAFWTGKNPVRIDRLFRRSALYRDKWEREDYKANSLQHAIGYCTGVYKQPSKEPERISVQVEAPPISETSSSPEYIEGYQFMDPSAQINYFANCFYIKKMHRVLTPHDGVVKAETFKAIYGGYVFALDSENHKTTKNAFEILTESQAVRFPKVSNVAFRPELPPYAVIDENGQTLVNSYVHPNIRMEQGDITPFIDHLSRLFPEEHDRRYILGWMAKSVQDPGHKHQWAPVIQGVEGNGKSFLMAVMEYCVGAKYAHFPNSQDLTNKFNDWVFEKRFIGIEEIHTRERRDVLDAMKPLITNGRIERQSKGIDQTMGDNRANFMMCTNHKDAVPITADSRRYAIYYTPQQTVSDLAVWGMDAGYFRQLYQWFRSGGCARIAHYLAKEYVIDQDVSDSLAHRAPVTTSTNEALRESLGSMEHEVMEAIEQGRYGFCIGWISSIALDNLIKNVNGRSISPKKKKEIINNLGYVPHPNLKDGRCTRELVEEGGKPRLYIREGSTRGNISSPSEIVDAYLADQAGATTKADEVFGKPDD